MRSAVASLVALGVLGGASDALAAGGSAAAVRDCQDGRIDGTYTAAEYRDALTSIPTDVDEYTDCRSTLRAAQLRAAGAPVPQPPGGAAAASAPAGSARSAPTSAAPGTAPTGTPVAPGEIAPGVAGPGAAPTPPTGTPAGASPAPTIPGLPTIGGPGPAPAPPGQPLVPTAPASRVTEQVPPLLALGLVVSAVALLVAAGPVRRRLDPR